MAQSSDGSINDCNGVCARDSLATWLGQSIAPLIQAHSGLSGVFALAGGLPASDVLIATCRSRSHSCAVSFFRMVNGPAHDFPKSLP